MAISPMLRVFRCAFGKLCNGFRLRFDPGNVVLSPFALTGDQPATVDTAAAADPQSSTTRSCPGPAPMSMAFHASGLYVELGSGPAASCRQGFTFNFFYITDALGDPTHPAGTDLRFSNGQRISRHD